MVRALMTVRALRLNGVRPRHVRITVVPRDTCTVDHKAPDGNNAQRIQKPNAQYQIFGTLTDINIRNVNFEFVPAAFTLCMNNQGWSGSVTADEVLNAELQMQNTGNVTFTNCNFDKGYYKPLRHGKWRI